MAATNSAVNRRHALCGIVLAASVGLTGVRGNAHALPGTVITLSGGAEALSMRLEIPLVELALALPDAGLDGTTLTPGQERLLTGYFRDHAILSTSTGVPLLAVDVRFALQEASDDHVGTYRLLVVDMGLSGRPVFPLLLRYDGVMHKVRNHRAAVFIGTTGGQYVPVGDIRYDFTAKTVPPLPIFHAP
jgi:hypothetical protein